MPAHFPNMSHAAPVPQVGLTPPLPWKYAHLIRKPDDPIVQQRFEFEQLAIKVREHLVNQIGVNTRDEAARMLWVQGRPGEGKSEGCLITCLKAGFHTTVLSPALFAGEVEGHGVKILHDIMEEMVRWSAAHHCRMVIIIDDFDLSTASFDANIGHTINSQLLVQEIMSLADNRHLYRNVDGANIAFVMTVNDATNMRQSLHRPGRAIWHDHVPTAEDKANIAWAILAPKTTTERKLVEALVAKHTAMPVAFWKALFHRMRALHAEQLIATSMPDQASVDAVYGQRMPLTPEIAWQAANGLRTSRVRNWLNKRSGWGW